jgi:hypothetical protein
MANVSVSNTTGLYIGSGASAVLNSAQQLLTLLSNQGNVNFALATGNTQVQGYFTGNAGGGGGTTYSNANVAAFLPTYGGTINSGTIFNDSGFAMQGRDYVQMQWTNGYTPPTSEYDIAIGAWYYIDAGGGVFQSNATGTLQTITMGHNGDLTASGNISGNYFVGNASKLNSLTGVAAGTYGSDISIPTIVVDATGRITQITTNVASGGGSYGNANVAAFLPTYTGSLALSSTIVALNANVGVLFLGNASTNANLGAFQTYANNTFGTGSYGNANVAAYLASNTDPTISNLNANSAVQAVSINSINANLGAFQTYSNTTNATTQANIGTLYLGNISINANLGAYQTYANTNAASQSTSINSINANLGAFQTYSNTTNSTTQANIGTLFLGNASTNANLGAYQTYTNTQISTINANVGTLFLGNASTNANLGAFQTYSNANAAVQSIAIDTINANLGAYQTYTNTAISQTNYYTNANVADFLPIYGGNILLGNAFVQSNLYVQSYTVSTYIFTSNTTWTAPSGNTIVSAKALIIGGGGAGGTSTSARSGGGGGAGGTLANVNISVASGGTYSIVVGGAGTAGGNVVTARGQSSSAFGFTANGGGYGGGSQGVGATGGRGGSGGGGYGVNYAAVVANGGPYQGGIASPGGQGYGGAAGQQAFADVNDAAAGGGGGAASFGVPGGSGSGGGPPIYDVISGANVAYGYGGAGTRYTNSGAAYTWIDPVTGVSTSSQPAAPTYGSGGSGGANGNGTSGYQGVVVVQLVQATYTGGTVIANSTVKTGNVIVSTGVFWGNGAVYSPSASSNFTSNLTVNGNYIQNAILETTVEKTANIGALTGTITVNANIGAIQTATLVGNIVVNTTNLTNFSLGESVTLVLTQDATGSRLLTSNLKYAGGSKTLSTTANSIDTISITYDGTNYLAALVKGYA